MEDIAASITRQYKQLQNTVTNHNKCAKAKRTLSYLQTHLETLDALFIEISKLHIDIISSPEEEAVVYNASEKYDKADDLALLPRHQILPHRCKRLSLVLLLNRTILYLRLLIKYMIFDSPPSAFHHLTVNTVCGLHLKILLII